MGIFGTLFAFFILLNFINMISARMSCEHEWVRNGSIYNQYCKKCGKEKHFIR